MEVKNIANRIHPLVAGAAVSVMLVSLTGVAAIAGWLPVSHSNNAPVAALSAPAAKPDALMASTTPTSPEASAPQADKSQASAQTQTAPRTASSSTAHHKVQSTKVAQADVVCHSCGRIEAIRPVKHTAPGSGVGMVAGAVLGGVLGNQVGGGNGRTLATVAGAVGGGYAGNEIEKHTRGSTSYQVHVRMDDGSTRTVSLQAQQGWQVGDRVKIVNGALTSRA